MFPRLLLLLLLLWPTMLCSLPLRAQTGIRCTQHPTLAEVQTHIKFTRAGLLERRHGEARRTLQLALELIPCVREPVPARVLAGVWFYDGFFEFLLGDQANARTQLERAITLSPALEWDDALGDPHTYRSFIQLISDIGAAKSREPPARVFLDTSGYDGRILIDGVEWQRDSEPRSLTAGRHLIQRQARQGVWEAAWLDLLPETEVIITSRMFRGATTTTPPAGETSCRPTAPPPRNALWLGVGGIQTTSFGNWVPPGEIQMPALWLTVDSHTKGAAIVSLAVGLSPSDTRSTLISPFNTQSTELPLFFRGTFAVGWPLGDDRIVGGGRVGLSFFDGEWSEGNTLIHSSVIHPEIGIEMALRSASTFHRHFPAWRIQWHVGTSLYPPSAEHRPAHTSLTWGVSWSVGIR